MKRIELLTKHLKYWQCLLGLQSWKLGIKITDFNRTDFPQSGDIRVDLKKKSATVLITKNETGRDRAIVLHELIHLLLWEYDHFCEKKFVGKDKDEYFDLLEKTVKDLTTIFLQMDKE
jgi:hypothetical protein